jgi:hypothetical protein
MYSTHPADAEATYGNALNAAEAEFGRLIAGPAPLSIDGRQIGHGLPEATIDLGELRKLLMRRDTGPQTRDAVWRTLVTQSRAGGDGDWTVGCIGVALPGLKNIAGRLARGPWISEVDDIASEIVFGFVKALSTIDLDRRRIAQRLCWQARQHATRARYRQSGPLPVPPETIGAPFAGTAQGGPDLILLAAVRQSVISAADAELIGATRLEGIELKQYAEDLGQPHWRLYKRRERAEACLARAIRDQVLHPEISDLMSNPGL